MLNLVAQLNRGVALASEGTQRAHILLCALSDGRRARHVPIALSYVHTLTAIYRRVRAGSNTPLFFSVDLRILSLCRWGRLQYGEDRDLQGNLAEIGTDLSDSAGFRRPVGRWLSGTHSLPGMGHVGRSAEA